MMTNKEKISIGGQAVIEGVVMRSSHSIATAVRRKDKTIEVKKELFTSITKKHRLLNIPIIRGFISLIEVLVIGVKTLNFSAARAELDFDNDNVKPKSRRREQLETFLAFFIAFVLAFGLFTYLPYQVAYLINLSQGSISFNLFTGLIRIVFFIGYVKGISLLKDIKRVFEYHGAEHKAVHAFENNISLTPQEVDKYSTIHPRCGTSFIFLVLLISILMFAVVDYIVGYYYGVPTLLARIGYHLLLLPLISGISYEVLKISDRYLHNPLVKLLTMPGMMLQRITTQPPDNDQLEVAIVALCSALNISLPEESDNKVIEIT